MEIYFMPIFILILSRVILVTLICHGLTGSGKFIDLTLMYMKTSTFCTTEGQILVFKVK